MRIFNMKDILAKQKGLRAMLVSNAAQMLEYEFGTNHMYCGWGNKRLGLETSPLANPYSHKSNARTDRKSVASRDEAVEMYRKWLWERICADDQAVLAELRRVTPTTALVCWCAPKRCHCEVISKAADWLHKKLKERVKKVISSDRLIVWVRDNRRIEVKLRNEVGGNGAYYTSVGWFGSCSCEKLIKNLEFLERGGSIKELYDPGSWGRVVNTRYGTEVWPE